MKKKNVLILGISGQDGTYLAHYLLKKKYRVIGISRRQKKIKNHLKLNIEKKIIIKNFDYIDYENLKKVIMTYKVDEIYFFAGQPKPNISNYKIIETLYSNIIPVYNIIDIIIKNNKKIKFFNSSSCEIFKATKKALDENSQKEPNSIYALSKLVSFEMVKFFREKFSLKICSGILFHHESILREKDYILRKIIAGAEKIKKNKLKFLTLGDIYISRDWGWAPEYVKLMHLILNKHKTDDYIIATGKTTKLIDVLKKTFQYYDLDWRKHIKYEKNLFRKFDSKTRKANIYKLKNDLKWKPKFNIDNVLFNLINEKMF